MDSNVTKSLNFLMTKMSHNIARLAALPGRRVAMEAMVPEAAADIALPQAVAPLRAELSARPCTLHDLWVEWIFGMTGRKPAKDFNSGERGAVKSK